MKAEIITIGSEIMLGQTLDTNSAYLGRRLASIGLEPTYQTSVGDNKKILSELIKGALERSDVVITTGGLGPTVDDVTKEVVANVLKRELILNKRILSQIKARFQKRRLRMPKRGRHQAFLPEGATVLDNREGTAPGFIVEHNKAVLISLPGPPQELKPMFEDKVFPYLKKKFGTRVTKTRLLKVVGLNESAVDEKLRDISKTRDNLEVGLIAHPTGVQIRITAGGPAGNEDSVKGLISQTENRIRERLGDYIFGVDEETLEKVVGVLLSLRRKSIAVAESCTGGLISHRLTNVPGSSNYFLDCVVAYSNQAKIDILKVRRETLNRFGAVSARVAQEMAEGISKISGATLGLAVTGIAGPGGTTQKKPVGLVYLALASDGTNSTEEHHFLGSREIIKEKASQAALDLVRKHLLKE